MWKMSATIDLTTRGTKRDSSKVGATTPSKKRKVDELNDFKRKAERVMKNLSDAAPAPFAAAGRLNAPTITVALKNPRKELHFPLGNRGAAEAINYVMNSADGEGRCTVAGATVIDSFHLSSGGFEILNPAWKQFINNELAYKIKKDMCIDFPFTLSLDKLLLLTSGAYFQPSQHSDNVNGSFANLVIQLPSFYKGGKMVTSLNGKSVTSDFGSADDDNSLGTFFTTFYHNCDQNVSMVTEGLRVCLIYHLITTIPVIPTAPRQHALEPALVNLINNWEHCGKLVYALKHKYLESDLTFENLMGTDRSIANFFAYIAKKYDLCIYLASLNKETSVRGIPAEGFESDFDSDDEDIPSWKSYSLNKLIANDGSNLLSTPLTVNFAAEVVTANCFENIDPCRKNRKANNDFSRFYNRAAIVFWPKRFLIEVPKKCGASPVDLDKIFLKEMESYRGGVNDNAVKTKLKNWAKEIISPWCFMSRTSKSISAIRAILELGDIQLIQSLFSSNVILNEVSLSLVVDVCEKYGWKTFASEVPGMFDDRLEKKDAIDLLGQIGIDEMAADKKAVVHSSMEVIVRGLHYSLNTDTNRCVAEQDFFLSACRLAEKLDFDMFEVLKKMPIRLIVPVLIKLVPNNSQKLTPFWKNVALHFVQEMAKEASKPVHTWRRRDRTGCSCNDCYQLNAFLASDEVRIYFKMGKERRKHLENRMFTINDISYDTNQRPYCVGVLVVQKTTETVPSDPETRSFSIANLPALQAILPN